jgi:beta-glucosidase
VRWNFAPVVAVVQDIRWGRTYEGYSENTELVARLGAAYIQGLQAGGGIGLSDPTAALASPKHYLGDGGTTFGSSITGDYLLDQGDLQVDEAALRRLYLPPYQAAVDAGALNIMVSFSSWNQVKMHAQEYLLTEVLKGELGFQGFLVSDWQAIDQITGDYYSDVVTSINAGLDMIMVPYDYNRFILNLAKAVNSGDVSMERIDDAVRRILRAKFALGLFENPFPDSGLLDQVGSDEHRQLARQAVRESVVLLVNENQALPLGKEAGLVFVAGQGADDIGLQSGGWTIEWQGRAGPITPGTTILDGIQQAVSAQTRVEYEEFGKFERFLDEQSLPLVADIGIAVVAEKPYAEGVGDRVTLDLPVSDLVMIDRLRAQSKLVVLVVLSGRPVVMTEALPKVEAVLAAWLPGTEGNGVADVLFGDYDPTGRLTYTWPRWSSQLPFDFANLPASGCDAPLFSFGYGLGFGDESPEILDCPR